MKGYAKKPDVKSYPFPHSYYTLGIFYKTRTRMFRGQRTERAVAVSNAQINPFVASVFSF